MGKIADPLREWVDCFDYPTLDKEYVEELRRAIRLMADEIDREHGNRMFQCRRETVRHCLHRVRSMMNDMERGIRWGRKKRLVRCKDCKHGFEDGGRVECLGPLTEPWDDYNDAPNHTYVEPNGFCKWGEPREKKWKEVK